MFCFKTNLIPFAFLLLFPTSIFETSLLEGNSTDIEEVDDVEREGDAMVDGDSVERSQRVERARTRKPPNPNATGVPKPRPNGNRSATPLEIVQLVEDSKNLNASLRNQVWKHSTTTLKRVFHIAPRHSLIRAALILNTNMSLDEQLHSKVLKKISYASLTDFPSKLSLHAPSPPLEPSTDRGAARMKEIREQILASSRPAVQQVLVVYYAELDTKVSFDAAKAEARKVRDGGVAIYVVHCEQNPSVADAYANDLVAIAGSSNRVYSVEDFVKDDWDDVKTRIVCNYNEVCGYGDEERKSCVKSGWWRSSLGTGHCNTSIPTVASKAVCNMSSCQDTCKIFWPQSMCIPAEHGGVKFTLDSMPVGMEEFVEYCPCHPLKRKPRRGLIKWWRTAVVVVCGVVGAVAIVVVGVVFVVRRWYQKRKRGREPFSTLQSEKTPKSFQRVQSPTGKMTAIGKYSGEEVSIMQTGLPEKEPPNLEVENAKQVSGLGADNVSAKGGSSDKKSVRALKSIAGKSAKTVAKSNPIDGLTKKGTPIGKFPVGPSTMSIKKGATM